MKHRVSVTVDKDNYQVLNAAGVNISGLVNEVIGKEARRIKAEEWKKRTTKGWRKSPDSSHRMALSPMKTGTGDHAIYRLSI